MPGAHIGSGSLAMRSDDKVRVTVGDTRLKFTADDEIDTQADFVIQVPFGQPHGRVSIFNMTNETETGNFRLSGTVTSGGDVHSITYSVYLI